MTKLTDIYNDTIKTLDAMRGVTLDEDQQAEHLRYVMSRVHSQGRTSCRPLWECIENTRPEDIELGDVKTLGLSNTKEKRGMVAMTGTVKFTKDETEHEGWIGVYVRTSDGEGNPTPRHAIVATALKTEGGIEIASQRADSWGDFDYRANYFTINDSRIPLAVAAHLYVEMDAYVKANVSEDMHRKIATRTPYGNIEALAVTAELSGIYPPAKKYFDLEKMFEIELPNYNKKKFRNLFIRRHGWFMTALVQAAHNREIPYDNVLAALEKGVEQSGYAWHLGDGEGEWEDFVELMAGYTDKSFRKLLKEISEAEPEAVERFTARAERSIGPMAHPLYRYDSRYRDELMAEAKTLLGGVEFTTLDEFKERTASAVRAMDSAAQEVVEREEMAKAVPANTIFSKAFGHFPATIEVEDKKYHVAPARVAGDLKKWGRQMENCIGGYADSALAGNRGYLAVYEYVEDGEQEQLDKLVGNIEFGERSSSFLSSNSITITQAYGKCNSRLPSGVVDATATFMLAACMEEKILLG